MRQIASPARWATATAISVFGWPGPFPLDLGFLSLTGVGVNASILDGHAEVKAKSKLTSAPLIGHSGSSTFELSTYAVPMSLAGSCFSSESAPGPFHHGIRGRGGTIFWTALPSVWRQVQAEVRTHLIHRPARDIFPPLGGALVFSYRV